MVLQCMLWATCDPPRELHQLNSSLLLLRETNALNTPLDVAGTFPEVSKLCSYLSCHKSVVVDRAVPVCRPQNVCPGHCLLLTARGSLCSEVEEARKPPGPSVPGTTYLSFCTSQALELLI